MLKCNQTRVTNTHTTITYGRYHTLLVNIYLWHVYHHKKTKIHHQLLIKNTKDKKQMVKGGYKKAAKMITIYLQKSSYKKIQQFETLRRGIGNTTSFLFSILH